MFCHGYSLVCTVPTTFHAHEKYFLLADVEETEV